MAEEVLRSLIRKLDSFAVLSDREKRALQDAIAQVQDYGPHIDLIREGDANANANVNVVLSGFACRQKTLPDGRRQIIGYLLPGDICDVCVFLLRRMDHTISTVSPVKVGIIPHETALQLIERYPRLMRAVWWGALVQESIAREWLINVGQRTALERLAHLFCEIFVRLRAVGLVDGDCCELPVTQAELADTLALSTVHVNRTLRELRRANLISIRARSLVIHDFKSLQRMAMFDPKYLHLDGERTPAKARRD
jgi:CRP-like cAMP-binding protein